MMLFARTALVDTSNKQNANASNNADLPDAAYGWSIPRCRQLGEDMLVGIRAVVQQLKTEQHSK